MCVPELPTFLGRLPTGESTIHHSFLAVPLLGAHPLTNGPGSVLESSVQSVLAKSRPCDVEVNGPIYHPEELYRRLAPSHSIIVA